MVIVVSIISVQCTAYKVTSNTGPGKLRTGGGGCSSYVSGVTIAGLVLLRVLSLKMSIARASVVPFRVLSRKTYHRTGDNVLSQSWYPLSQGKDISSHGHERDLGTFIYLFFKTSHKHPRSFYVGVSPGEINPFVVFTCPHQHTPCFCLSWTLMDIRQDIAPCLLSSQLDKHSTARHCLVLCSLRSKQNVVSYWSSTLIDDLWENQILDNQHVAN